MSERTLAEAHRARVSLGDAFPDDARREDAAATGDVWGDDTAPARVAAVIWTKMKEGYAAVLASGAARRGEAPGAGAREVATNEGHVCAGQTFIKKIMTVAFLFGWFGRRSSSHCYG